MKVNVTEEVLYSLIKNLHQKSECSMSYGQFAKQNGKCESHTSYVYIITRKDLTFPQQCVQSCHAAINAAGEFSFQVHPHLVLCSVSNEKELQNLCDKIRCAGILFTSFREPDLGNCLTAIATEPVWGRGRKVFRHLHLLDESPTQIKEN